MKCKLISCDCKKKDKAFIFPLVIYAILTVALIIIKEICHEELNIPKAKDVILIDPLLTYFGESLFFIVDLICRNFSYSEVIDYKICIKDYIYFGLICLLLLIIDFYKIYILIFLKTISYESFIMIINSWIFLLIFSILIGIFLYKMRFYKHHLFSIFPFILFEIYIIFTVISFGKGFDIILFLVQIFMSLIESIIIILIKNIIEKKFFSPLKVCYLIGFINLMISFIILVILSNVKCDNYLESCKENENIFDFSSIYKNKFVFICLFPISLFNGINKYLINTILKKYTILHTSIFYQYNSMEFLYLIKFNVSITVQNSTISKITGNILTIFYSLGVFLLLIFHEVIILNFCNLSYNIKKNIQARADKEFNDIIDNDAELKTKLDLDDIASSNYKDYIDSEIMKKE